MVEIEVYNDNLGVYEKVLIPENLAKHIGDLEDALMDAEDDNAILRDLVISFMTTSSINHKVHKN